MWKKILVNLRFQIVLGLERCQQSMVDLEILCPALL
jgi:hypothetical protein